MKEPSAGPEIMDLLTLPFLPVFFFVGDEAALAEKTLVTSYVSTQWVLIPFSAFLPFTFL